jgi:hypothetical protein
MKSQESDDPKILISLDTDGTRGISIYYQDLRPLEPRKRGNSVLSMLNQDIDCLELSFENQNADPIPYREIFFNEDELNTIFEHARWAVQASRNDNHAIDPKSGRLVRYDHNEAVRLGIIAGYDTINLE